MSGSRVEDAAKPTGLVAATANRVERATPKSTRAVAGVLGLLPVAATTLYRVAHNTPAGLPAGVPEFVALWYPFAILGPALAGFLLATTAETASERVGLTFLGGFGLISLASATAWIPAAVGIAVGGGVVVWSRLARLKTEEDWDEIRRVTPTVLLIVGVGVSLAATVGVAPTTLRPLGTILTLLALGLAPVVTGWDLTSLGAGVGAGLVTLALATSLPYVAGAVLLVGGGVVGAPLGLVAFAVGGGVTGVVFSLRDERVDRALGAALLLVAGVPATLLSAAGVLVAVALLATESRGEIA
ncbi:hypothetical protein KU306_18400 (plasmid) [Haloferax larsenii]|uniref:DUF8068 domain-containing protein n=1 Tax=Haloferax larsenii TaxID=302484 RepID=A0ABY5RLM6_HALLR|nr:hypothetical protein [Haloferax larsenii]ELZ80128.1 hypothetical protein C455_07175 [Haloferax larsenii JCM 13917]UVE52298.1 hypothetical protein KU306_18400 [Haloferax larsenii]